MSPRPPTISVLMTAYNRADYIAASIESVLAQTFTDFELIVVDDESTDATVAIVQRYFGDSRLRLIENDRNLGDYPNRNHAATFARGEFMKYHDSDDVMYPHCLEVMLAGLRAVPDAAFAVSTGRAWSGGPCPMRLTPRLSYEREFLGSSLFHVGASGALFRTTAFRALGGFPQCGAASDYILWMRACAHLNVVLVPADLFWYRVHSGQEIGAAQSLVDYAVANSEAWTMLHSPECPLAAADLTQARRNRAWVIGRAAIRHLIAGRIGPARCTLARSGLRVTDWVRYFRPPVRHAAAGTPPDAGLRLGMGNAPPDVRVS